MGAEDDTNELRKIAGAPRQLMARKEEERSQATQEQFNRIMANAEAAKAARQPDSESSQTSANAPAPLVTQNTHLTHVTVLSNEPPAFAQDDPQRASNWGTEWTANDCERSATETTDGWQKLSNQTSSRELLDTSPRLDSGDFIPDGQMQEHEL